MDELERERRDLVTNKRKLARLHDAKAERQRMLLTWGARCAAMVIVDVFLLVFAVGVPSGLFQTLLFLIFVLALGATAMVWIAAGLYTLRSAGGIAHQALIEEPRLERERQEILGRTHVAHGLSIAQGEEEMRGALTSQQDAAGGLEIHASE